ncbi:hypothetical protein CYMTET_44903, partial [Cymbomonas tetramitiformis]
VSENVQPKTSQLEGLLKEALQDGEDERAKNKLLLEEGQRALAENRVLRQQVKDLTALREEKAALEIENRVLRDRNRECESLEDANRHLQNHLADAEAKVQGLQQQLKAKSATSAALLGTPVMRTWATCEPWSPAAKGARPDVSPLRQSIPPRSPKQSLQGVDTVARRELDDELDLFREGVQVKASAGESKQEVMQRLREDLRQLGELQAHEPGNEAHAAALADRLNKHMQSIQEDCRREVAGDNIARAMEQSLQGVQMQLARYIADVEAGLKNLEGLECLQEYAEIALSPSRSSLGSPWNLPVPQGIAGAAQQSESGPGPTSAAGSAAGPKLKRHVLVPQVTPSTPASSVNSPMSNISPARLSPGHLPPGDGIGRVYGAWGLVKEEWIPQPHSPSTAPRGAEPHVVQQEVVDQRVAETLQSERESHRAELGKLRERFLSLFVEMVSLKEIIQGYHQNTIWMTEVVGGYQENVRWLNETLAQSREKHDVLQLQKVLLCSQMVKMEDEQTEVVRVCMENSARAGIQEDQCSTPKLSPYRSPIRSSSPLLRKSRTKDVPAPSPAASTVSSVATALFPETTSSSPITPTTQVATPPRAAPVVPRLNLGALTADNAENQSRSANVAEGRPVVPRLNLGALTADNAENQSRSANVAEGRPVVPRLNLGALTADNAENQSRSANVTEGKPDDSSTSSVRQNRRPNRSPLSSSVASMRTVGYQKGQQPPRPRRNSPNPVTSSLDDFSLRRMATENRRNRSTPEHVTSLTPEPERATLSTWEGASTPEECFQPRVIHLWWEACSSESSGSPAKTGAREGTELERKAPAVYLAFLGQRTWWFSTETLWNRWVQASASSRQGDPLSGYYAEVERKKLTTLIQDLGVEIYEGTDMHKSPRSEGQGMDRQLQLVAKIWVDSSNASRSLLIVNRHSVVTPSIAPTSKIHSTPEIAMHGCNLLLRRHCAFASTDH